MERRFTLPSFCSIVALVASTCPAIGRAQAMDQPNLGIAVNAVALPGEVRDRTSGLSATGFDSFGDSSSELSSPMAGEPAAGSGEKQRDGLPWEGTRHWGPLSRMSIGADVSPLGIGIKSAVILSEYFDARLMGNFFNYDTGNFELEGFKVDANVHMASLGASVDVYPMNSIWRLSGGLMFLNGNQISATTEIVPGTSFSLDGQNFYSASANPATGATPLTGSGVVGFHSREPALMVSGGFGRFIPRSNRHWSFPAELGVLFMGAPTIDVTTSGWVCKDVKQTKCSDISDSSNPVGQAFNSSLQTQLAKWRKSLGVVTIYPIFSYSVVYSFNLP